MMIDDTKPDDSSKKKGDFLERLRTSRPVYYGDDERDDADPYEQNAIVLPRTREIFDKSYQAVLRQLDTDKRFARWDVTSKLKAGPTAVIWLDSLGFVESLLRETLEFLRERRPAGFIQAEFFDSLMARELLSDIEDLFDFSGGVISLKSDYQIDVSAQSKKGRVKGRPWGLCMHLIGSFNKILWQCIPIYLNLQKDPQDQHLISLWHQVYVKRYPLKDERTGPFRATLVLADLPLVRPFLDFAHHLTGVKERAMLVYLETYRLASELGCVIEQIIAKHEPDPYKRKIAISRLHDYPLSRSYGESIYRERFSFEFILKAWKAKRFENKTVPNELFQQVFEENFMLAGDSSKEIEKRLRSLQDSIQLNIPSDGLLYKEEITTWFQKVVFGLGDALLVYEIPAAAAQKSQPGRVSSDNVQHFIAVFQGFPFKNTTAQFDSNLNLTSLHICLHHASGIRTAMGSNAKVSSHMVMPGSRNLSQSFHAFAAGNLFNLFGWISTPKEAHATLILTHGLSGLRSSSGVNSHFHMNARSRSEFLAMDVLPYPVFEISDPGRESETGRQIKDRAQFNFWNKDIDLTRPLTLLRRHGENSGGIVHYLDQALHA